jgi:metal-sulfur cluster biosynthetic enzyme
VTTDQVPASASVGGPADQPSPVFGWLADRADPQLIFQLLEEVIDPELGVNIVDLGLIYGVRVNDRIARVRMTLTTPGCPLSGYMDDEIRRTLAGTPGIDETELVIVWGSVVGPGHDDRNGQAATWVAAMTESATRETPRTRAIRCEIGWTAARRRRARLVPPLLAIAVIMLLAGLWEGLVYLGLPLPAGQASLHDGHGPLMVLGFLGTLISLERAVALSAAWAYLAPAGAAAGGLAVVVGAPNGVGQALVAAAGVVLVLIFVAIHRIQASVHNIVLASGALCWVVAGGLWLAGWDVPRFIPWLVGFLVLTITGERLELSRVAGSTRLAYRLFTCAAGTFGAGLIVSTFSSSAGVRVAGVGLLALALWLSRYDIARRTIRGRGVTRYMAAALLTGYAWLAVGGGLWIAVGYLNVGDGGGYDAMLHAIFLGFVISMIFAHAPVTVPSVLSRPLPFHGSFYAPLAFLHLTLLLRLVRGDAFGNRLAWQ